MLWYIYVYLSSFPVHPAQIMINMIKLSAISNMFMCHLEQRRGTLIPRNVFNVRRAIQTSQKSTIVFVSSISNSEYIGTYHREMVHLVMKMLCSFLV